MKRNQLHFFSVLFLIFSLLFFSNDSLAKKVKKKSKKQDTNFETTIIKTEKPKAKPVVVRKRVITNKRVPVDKNEENLVTDQLKEKYNLATKSSPKDSKEADESSDNNKLSLEDMANKLDEKSNLKPLAEKNKQLDNLVAMSLQSKDDNNALTKNSDQTTSNKGSQTPTKDTQNSQKKVNDKTVLKSDTNKPVTLKGSPKKTEFIKQDDSLQLKSESMTVSYSYKKVILWIVILAGMLFGLVYVWKYLQNKSFGIFPRNDQLKILAQQAVDQKSKILIVEALGKKFLVGATQERIQLLSDLDFYGIENNPEEVGFEENMDSFQAGVPTQAQQAASSVNKVRKEVQGRPQGLQRKSSTLAQAPFKGSQSTSMRPSERIKNKLKELKKI